MIKMEVVEFIVETQQSGREATLRPVNWLASSKWNGWGICISLFSLERHGSVRPSYEYSQSEEWFPSYTTALSLLCNTSYPTLDAPDFPHCTLLLQYQWPGYTRAKLSESIRFKKLEASQEAKRTGIFGVHGPLEPVKRSEIKGYWPVDFLETQRAPWLQPSSSSHNTGIIKVLQVTDSIAYEIRKISGKFTLHFILLQLSLNKLLISVTNWKSLWRTQLIPLQEILKNIL